MTTRDKYAQVITSFSGDAIKHVIKKATTRVETPPKRKHIRTIVTYLMNPRAQVVHLVDILGERFRKTSWVISMKSLFTTHLLFNAGVEAFQRQVASRVSIFQLDGYIDRMNMLSIEMSCNIILYAKFLDKKSAAFRELGRDVTIHPKEIGSVSLESCERISKELDILIELSETIISTKIDFSNLSSVWCCVQTLLFNEMLRIYTGVNVRIIYFIQNIEELEAIEAAKMFSVYQKYHKFHKELEKIAAVGAEKNIEQARNLTLINLPEEVTLWIESAVKDIIRQRGSRKLQNQWGLIDSNTPRKSFIQQVPNDIVSLQFEPNDDLLKFDPLKNDSLASLSDLESLNMANRPQIEYQGTSRTMNSSPMWEDNTKYTMRSHTQLSDIFDNRVISETTAKSFSQTHPMQISLKSTQPKQPPRSNDIEQLLLENLNFNTQYDEYSPHIWDRTIVSNNTQTVTEEKTEQTTDHKSNNPFF